MPRKPRQTYHHGDLRAAILDEATTTLAKDGIEAVTLRRIAASLGVSHAAPAHHFPTRDALLGALAGRGYGQLRDAMQGALRNGNASAKHGLAAIGLAYVRFALEQPNLFRLMFGGAVSESQCDVEGLAAAAQCQAVLRTAVAEACAAPKTAGEGAGSKGALGRASEGPSPLPREGLASWALVHGLATLWIDRQVEDFFPAPAAKQHFLAAVAQLLG